MEYTVYTDGGYSKRQDIGAFSYVMLQDDKIVKERSCKRYGETNNRMEMKAIIAAVFDAPEGCTLHVKSDSQYAIRVLDGTYESKANIDLVQMYSRLVAARSLTMDLEWVKGHNGDMWNEYCDQLCNQAAGFDLNAEYEFYKRDKR